MENHYSYIRAGSGKELFKIMKQKNRWRTLAILAYSLMGVGLIGCGIIYQLFTQQCILWTCAPSRAFTINDLTLPVNLYPTNAFINLMQSSPESPGADSGIINIYWEEHGQLYKSIFVINRFGTEKRAIKHFDTVKTWRSQSSYHPHRDITFRSQIADEYEIGCGISRFGGEVVCDLDARYEEFVISLNASMSGQMNQKTFQEIVINVDKQFESFLSN